MKIAIIGTSGRTLCDKERLTANHFEFMAFKVCAYIKNVLHMKTTDITLVSGGSSWADHVAIQLFLTGDFAGLELYLPAQFNMEIGRYVNTYEGNLLNTLHMECYKKTGINVFKEFTNLQNKNVKIFVIKGFKNRNTVIAKNCDYLIAFTFDYDKPVKGGTLDTWNKTNATKVHFRLQ